MHKLKQWFKSRTFSFGLMLSIMGAVQIYVDTLQDPIYTMIAGIIVILLRFQTVEAIEDK